MRQVVSIKHYATRNLLIVLLIVFGFISSRALISIGTGLLALNLLLSFKEHRWQFVKNSNLPFFVISSYFFISLLWLIFSPDFKLALEQIYHRLPWLVIPLSFAAMRKAPKELIHLVLALFVFFISVSGIVVLINYFSNFSYLTEEIAKAKNIPSPLNHIRYSLMVGFAALLSIYLAIKNVTRLSPFDRKFFAVSAIFLFVLLHILSVRSGLMSFYIGALFLIVYFSVLYKKWWLVPSFAVLLFAIPLFAYYTVPSFHNKIDYMRYDFEQLQAGNIGHNSDARRWRSFEIAIELIKNKPIVGYGLGQVEKSSNAYYENNYPEVADYNRKIPHNQFLFSAVEMGILGSIFLLVILLFPITRKGVFNNPLLVVLVLVILSSCLVENTLQSQLGLTFYLIFVSLLIKSNEDE